VVAPKGAGFFLQDFFLRCALQGELLEELFLFSSVKPVNSQAGFHGAGATRSSVPGLQN